jgi:hypothetical protein
VRKLSSLIQKWVPVPLPDMTYIDPPGRLVDDLGLHSTLTEYKVPREDVPSIAAKSVGGEDQPDYGRVVKLLEGLY